MKSGNAIMLKELTILKLQVVKARRRSRKQLLKEIHGLRTNTAIMCKMEARI